MAALSGVRCSTTPNLRAIAIALRFGVVEVRPAACCAFEDGSALGGQSAQIDVGTSGGRMGRSDSTAPS